MAFSEAVSLCRYQRQLHCVLNDIGGTLARKRAMVFPSHLDVVLVSKASRPIHLPWSDELGSCRSQVTPVYVCQARARGCSRLRGPGRGGLGGRTASADRWEPQQARKNHAALAKR